MDTDEISLFGRNDEHIRIPPVPKQSVQLLGSYQ